MRKLGSTTELVSLRPALTDCTVAWVSSRRACKLIVVALTISCDSWRPLT